MGEKIIAVHICGIGPLRRIVGERSMELPEGATVAVLASCLNISRDYNEVYLVNGRRRGHDERLKHGDIVKIVSLVGGG